MSEDPISYRTKPSCRQAIGKQNTDHHLRRAGIHVSVRQWDDAWAELELIRPNARAQPCVMELRAGIYRGVGKIDEADMIEAALRKRRARAWGHGMYFIPLYFQE